MDNNDYVVFDGVKRYMPDDLHKRMAARIAELEAAPKLVQVDADEDLDDPINACQIQTLYSGTAFILTGYVTEADCIHLPVGYCIAKWVKQ